MGVGPFVTYVYNPSTMSQHFSAKTKWTLSTPWWIVTPNLWNMEWNVSWNIYEAIGKYDILPCKGMEVDTNLVIVRSHMWRCS